MNRIENTTCCQSHLEIPKAATEPQALISWGEQLLDHAQRVAREIEEQVRCLLATSPSSDGSSSHP